MLDLILKSGLSLFASLRIIIDCSNDALGSLTMLSSRGTHSTLCANTLIGRLSRRFSNAFRFPSKSEHKSSKPTSGVL